MKLRFLTALLFLAPALLPGQNTTTVIYPGPNYAELKQYLSLTDAQVQSLQTILDSRNKAAQDIYTQINQKNDALYKMLDSGAGTAAQLGQFLLDIRNLQKQLPLSDGPYKTQSLNVLTADQKTKLPKLTEAINLQSTASQAGMLLLIDYPVSVITPIGVTGAPMAVQSLVLPSVNR